MSEVLIDCTEGLPARKYGACDQLNKSYPEWLSKHVDVNREIESESNGNNGKNQDNETSKNTSKSFDRAKENQQQFVSTVQRFNRTRRAYQNARENSSTQRSRARGRELLSLARRTRNVSTNLTANYRVIGNASRTNVTRGITTINNTTENISAIVRNISAEQFTNTTLTVSASPRRISYLRPLSLNGELADENGTPLSGKRVVLRVGNYTRKTTTMESGEFSFNYRPALVALDTHQATVRYVPKDLSPYLGNETMVPITIKQVKPTITISSSPHRVSFNDSVTVAGRVSVDGNGVSSIPLAVSIDGQRLKSTPQTTSTRRGRYRTTGHLPAEVLAGNRTVRIALPFQNRALAGIAVTNPITVIPTSTKLSVNAPDRYAINRSNESERMIPVAGRLRIKNGTAIPGRSVKLRLNGTTVGEARTTQNGRYRANISIPQQLLTKSGGTTSITLAAVYEGHGTSFEASQARTQVTVIPPDRGLLEQLLSGFDDLPAVYQLLLGIVLVLLGGLFFYAVRRRYLPGETSSQSTAASEPDSANSNEDAHGKRSFIERAREQLTAGDTDRVIFTVYAAVRVRLSDAFGLTSTQTHREFLAACRDRMGGKTQFNLLSRLTDAYEQAAFAPQTISEETSTGAIEDAQHLENGTAVDDSRSDED